jgi:hypothetical protein
MCAERMQRILMAIVLSVIACLFYSGVTTVALILQSFVILMILVWAFTNFCPSIWIFEKLFGKCDWDKKSE